MRIKCRWNRWGHEWHYEDGQPYSWAGIPKWIREWAIYIVRLKF